MSYNISAQYYNCQMIRTGTCTAVLVPSGLVYQLTKGLKLKTEYPNET